MLKLPGSISDFKSIITEGYTIVDKTLFIKEIIDDPWQVLLIPRPRRFGKTTNMSMLRYFFDCTEDNKYLFDDLNITHAGDAYMRHQGQYPVVFISLKEASATNFTEFVLTLQHLMQKCFGHHRYLSSSDKMAPEDKNFFKKILDGNANTADLKQSLVFLTQTLQKHHQKPVILLIDEYDAPMHASFASTTPYLEEMTDFMRGFLGAALKDNNALHKAVVTGILQIAQASLFSGLNNINVCSLLEPEYGDCFGFTQHEVDELFEKAKLPYNKDEIKEWYNGYRIGNNTTVYNPWSIISCILKKGQIAPYWLETGDHGPVGKVLQSYKNTPIFEDIKKLMEKGGAIRKVIQKQTVFGNLSINESALWNLLLFAGYLSPQSVKMIPQGTEYDCVFSAPNREVQGAFLTWAQTWFKEAMGGKDEYIHFARSLAFGKVDYFIQEVKNYLALSVSYFDLSKKTKEQTYHVFLLGLLAGMRGYYDIKSNQESGNGRFDIMLIPHEKEEQVGVVIELKAVDKPEQLTDSSQEALTQIQSHDYVATLRALQVSSILSMGISFCGKEVEMAYAMGG